MATAFVLGMFGGGLVLQLQKALGLTDMGALIGILIAVAWVMFLCGTVRLLINALYGHWPEED
jgi:hypothetical protein